MKEKERKKTKKMKENERKWKKMKENEIKKMKENERKWKKRKENCRLLVDLGSGFRVMLLL